MSKTKAYQEGQSARRDDKYGEVCQSPYPRGSAQDKDWTTGWLDLHNEIWFLKYGIDELHSLNKAAEIIGISREKLDLLIQRGKATAIKQGAWRTMIHGREIQRLRESNDLP